MLAFRGFLAWIGGRMEAAGACYEAALAADPGNLLARSYMGRGIVAVGDLDGALS
jgi:hypothetical protein